MVAVAPSIGGGGGVGSTQALWAPAGDPQAKTARIIKTCNPGTVRRKERCLTSSGRGGTLPAHSAHSWRGSQPRATLKVAIERMKNSCLGVQKNVMVNS